MNNVDNKRASIIDRNVSNLSGLTICVLYIVLACTLYVCLPSRSQLYPTIGPASPGDGFLWGVTIHTLSQLRKFHGASRPPFLARFSAPWDSLTTASVQPPTAIMPSQNDETELIGARYFGSYPTYGGLIHAKAVEAECSSDDQIPLTKDVCNALASSMPYFQAPTLTPSSLASALSIHPDPIARTLSVIHPPPPMGVPGDLHGREAVVALALDVLLGLSRPECGGETTKPVRAHGAERTERSVTCAHRACARDAARPSHPSLPQRVAAPHSMPMPHAPAPPSFPSAVHRISAARVLTLDGSAGTGKSALVAEVLARLRTQPFLPREAAVARHVHAYHVHLRAQAVAATANATGSSAPLPASPLCGWQPALVAVLRAHTPALLLADARALLHTARVAPPRDTLAEALKALQALLAAQSSWLLVLEGATPAVEQLLDRAFAWAAGPYAPTSAPLSPSATEAASASSSIVAGEGLPQHAPPLGPTANMPFTEPRPPRNVGALIIVRAPAHPAPAPGGAVDAAAVGRAARAREDVQAREEARDNAGAQSQDSRNGHNGRESERESATDWVPVPVPRSVQASGLAWARAPKQGTLVHLGGLSLRAGVDVLLDTWSHSRPQLQAHASQVLPLVRDSMREAHLAATGEVGSAGLDGVWRALGLPDGSAAHQSCECARGASPRDALARVVAGAVWLNYALQSHPGALVRVATLHGLQRGPVPLATCAAASDPIASGAGPTDAAAPMVTMIALAEQVCMTVHVIRSLLPLAQRCPAHTPQALCMVELAAVLQADHTLRTDARALELKHAGFPAWSPAPPLVCGHERGQERGDNDDLRAEIHCAAAVRARLAHASTMPAHSPVRAVWLLFHLAAQSPPSLDWTVLRGWVWALPRTGARAMDPALPQSATILQTAQWLARVAVWQLRREDGPRRTRVWVEVGSGLRAALELLKPLLDTPSQTDAVRAAAASWALLGGKLEHEVTHRALGEISGEITPTPVPLSPRTIVASETGQEAGQPQLQTLQAETLLRIVASWPAVSERAAAAWTPAAVHAEAANVDLPALAALTTMLPRSTLATMDALTLNTMNRLAVEGRGCLPFPTDPGTEDSPSTTHSASSASVDGSAATSAARALVWAALAVQGAGLGEEAAVAAALRAAAALADAEVAPTSVGHAVRVLLCASAAAHAHVLARTTTSTSTSTSTHSPHHSPHHLAGGALAASAARWHAWVHTQVPVQSHTASADSASRESHGGSTTANSNAAYPATSHPARHVHLLPRAIDTTGHTTGDVYTALPEDVLAPPEHMPASLEGKEASVLSASAMLGIGSRGWLHAPLGEASRAWVRAGVAQWAAHALCSVDMWAHTRAVLEAGLEVDSGAARGDAGSRAGALPLAAGGAWCADGEGAVAHWATVVLALEQTSVARALQLLPTGKQSHTHARTDAATAARNVHSTADSTADTNARLCMAEHALQRTAVVAHKQGAATHAQHLLHHLLSETHANRPPLALVPAHTLLVALQLRAGSRTEHPRMPARVHALLSSLTRAPPAAATVRAWAHALEGRAHALLGAHASSVSSARAAAADLADAGLVAGEGVWALQEVVSALVQRVTRGAAPQLWWELADAQEDVAAAVATLSGDASPLARQWRRRAAASRHAARVRSRSP